MQQEYLMTAAVCARKEERDVVHNNCFHHFKFYTKDIISQHGNNGDDKLKAQHHSHR